MKAKWWSAALITGLLGGTTVVAEKEPVTLKIFSNLPDWVSIWGQPSFLDEVLDAYFDESGLNYRLGRAHLYSCDFSMEQYEALSDENKRSEKPGRKAKEEFRGQWAKYICLYIKKLQEEGCMIERLSLQNEPAAVQTWDSCIYTAEEEKIFLRDFRIVIENETVELEMDYKDMTIYWVYGDQEESLYEIGSNHCIFLRRNE